jgi:hypothetical protein
MLSKLSRVLAGGLVVACLCVTAAAQGRSGSLPVRPGSPSGTTTRTSTMEYPAKRTGPLSEARKRDMFAKYPRAAEVLGVSRERLVEEFDAAHAQNWKVVPGLFIAYKALLQAAEEKVPGNTLTLKELLDAFKAGTSVNKVLEGKNFTPAQVKEIREAQRSKLRAIQNKQ